MNRYIFSKLISGREFDDFINSKTEFFHNLEIEFSYKYCVPTDNSALVLDFDTTKYIARITVWESGECDIEALYTSKEGQVLDEHYEFTSVEDFYDKIFNVVQFLINN